ncbi:MAG TPA: hypothetical protein VIU29_09420 [Candidatus Deferrimicrobiaceae bacterium]
MRRRLNLGTCALAFLSLAALAGCGGASRFSYKPVASSGGALRLPVKVAVLPFKDATEDFTTRGNLLVPSGRTLNLVKAGIPGTADALTPELWGKAFADDLAASGAFRTVGFFYSRSEPVDEDLLIEGTVRKAYCVGSMDRPSEIELAFRALRRADGRVAWEKDVSRVWTPRIVRNCGFGVRCIIDQRYEDINRAMQALFAEAREDLVRTLALLPEGGAATGATPPRDRPAGAKAGSVEETIEDILDGK